MHRLSGFVLAVYWTALFIGTHVPLPAGTLPGDSDKLAHLAAYAGLAFLLGMSVSLRGTGMVRTCVIAFAVVAVYAVIDELLQIPVGRNADFYDCLADWIGAVLGIASVLVGQAIWRRQHRGHASLMPRHPR